jgi:hypothetical protein
MRLVGHRVGPRFGDLVAYARGVLEECSALAESQVQTRQLALPFLDIEARFTSSAYASDCDRNLVPRQGRSA